MAAGAQGAVLARIAADGLTPEPVAVVGLAEDAVRHWRQRSDSGSALAEAAAAGGFVEVRGSLLPDELATGSSVVLPLLSAGRTLGVLALEFGVARVRDATEKKRLVAFAGEVAHAFDALDRSILETRASSLQDLTAALAELHTSDQIAAAIVAHGVKATNAAAGGVTLLDADRTHLRFAASVGYKPRAVVPFDPLPLEIESPYTEAVGSGEIVVCETSLDFDDRYPAVRARRGEPAHHAVAAVPLAVDGPPIGALGFSFEPPRLFPTDEIDFMSTLSHICAQAFDRAEQARLHSRTAGLQSLTAELGKALTPRDVAAAVIRTATAVLGAVGARIAVMDSASQLVTLQSSAYPDGLLEHLRNEDRLHSMPGPVAADTGKLVLIGSLRTAGEKWEVAAEALGSLGYAAAVALPLRTRDRLVGTVAFAWKEERRFTSEDVSFLWALAGVCEQALERTRLHEHQKRAALNLQRLLDHLGEAVVVVGAGLQVAFANEEAREMFGGELVGRTLPDRWPELRLRELARHQLDDDAEPQSELVTLEDGRTIEIVAMQHDDGAAIVLRDVSRRERQERAQREFVSNASHELRTPLAAIAAAADALERGAKDVPAERDFYVGGIVDEVDRLVRLSDALLLLARAQADPTTLRSTEIEVAPIVSEAALRLEVRPGVRVSIDCDESCMIAGERALVEGALSNIARNAARLTESGSIVLACRREGETIAVSVADTGPGMGADVRARAASRFFRGGPRLRDGFGLGLAIASEMVTALGGELEIESRKGIGTTVTMRFRAG